MNRNKNLHVVIVMAVAMIVAASGQVSQAASAYSDSVLTTNPVIYYDYDTVIVDPTFPFVDLAPVPGGANNGFVGFNAAPGGAGPRPSDGFPNMDPSNEGATLDGTNDATGYHETASTAGIGTASYSMQTWFISPVEFGSRLNQYVLGRGDLGVPRDMAGVSGTAGVTGQLFYYDGVRRRAPQGSTFLSPNTWYHLVMTRQANDVKVYLNGQLEIDQSFPWAGGPGEYATFGARTDYNVFSPGDLLGRVDEAAVWDRTLSAAEVEDLYQAAIPEPTSVGLAMFALVGLAAFGRRRPNR